MSAAPMVVDWVSLLAELRKLGFSLRAIGEQIGLSHSSLVEYAQGLKRPNHASGERVLAFYCQATGKAREQVPMEPEPLRA